MKAAVSDRWAGPPIRRLLFALLGLLLAQNLLGTATNLWVTVPSNVSGAGVWAWVFSSAPLLAAHVLVALALLGMFAGVVARSRYRPDRRAVGTAWVGLIGVLVAIGGGGLFLFFGQANGFSLTMESGFAAAIGSVAILLYLEGSGRSSRPGPTGAVAAEPSPTGSAVSDTPHPSTGPKT